MRALVAALFALAAVAVVPSVSASAAAEPDPICVPPDPFQLGACVVFSGSEVCVLARVGPPVHGACVDLAGPHVRVCLFDACIPIA